MKRPRIVQNEIYHVLNRGVDKRDIFIDDKDRHRFIHDLYEFNDIEPTVNLNYQVQKRSQSAQSIEVGLRYIGQESRKSRKLLVEILAFCMMQNHFHLLLRPKSDKAITIFMRKLGTGYTNYFNQRYGRDGSLFQGKYKAIHVNKEAHFIHLPYYIHLNPLDLIMPEWRERELKDYKKAFEYLENYKWSSFQDYIGKKNFPSVTQREFLTKFFDGPEEYKKSTLKWLADLDLEAIKPVILE